jgi:ribosomal protein S18 acetylase RimI-like enzyme
VAADNDAAIALYAERGLGLRPVGRRRRYYRPVGDVGVDALIMSRELS